MLCVLLAQEERGQTPKPDTPSIFIYFPHITPTPSFHLSVSQCTVQIIGFMESLFSRTAHIPYTPWDCHRTAAPLTPQSTTPGRFEGSPDWQSQVQVVSGYSNQLRCRRFDRFLSIAEAEPRRSGRQGLRIPDVPQMEKTQRNTTQNVFWGLNPCHVCTCV